MLARLWEHGQIDWSRQAVIDDANVASPWEPRNRLQSDRPGQSRPQKRRLVVNARGVLSTFTATGSSRHDSIAFEFTLDTIPAESDLDGRPRKHPDQLHADKGYDCRRCRADIRRSSYYGAYCSKRDRTPRTPNKTSLGRQTHPYVARRTDKLRI